MSFISLNKYSGNLSTQAYSVAKRPQRHWQTISRGSSLMLVLSYPIRADVGVILPYKG